MSPTLIQLVVWLKTALQEPDSLNQVDPLSESKGVTEKAVIRGRRLQGPGTARILGRQVVLCRSNKSQGQKDQTSVTTKHQIRKHQAPAAVTKTRYPVSGDVLLPEHLWRCCEASG